MMFDNCFLEHRHRVPRIIPHRTITSGDFIVPLNTLFVYPEVLNRVAAGLFICPDLTSS